MIDSDTQSRTVKDVLVSTLAVMIYGDNQSRIVREVLVSCLLYTSDAADES